MLTLEAFFDFVHHILPLSDGGTNDENNFQSLCAEYHPRLHAERVTDVGAAPEAGGIVKMAKFQRLWSGRRVACTVFANNQSPSLS